MPADRIVLVQRHLTVDDPISVEISDPAWGRIKVDILGRLTHPHDPPFHAYPRPLYLTVGAPDAL